MLVCVFFAILHARRPVQRAPGIPCALYSRRRERSCKTSGESCRGIAEICLECERVKLLVVIARLDRAIRYSTGVSDRTEKPRRTGKQVSTTVRPARHSPGRVLPRREFHCPLRHF